MSVVEGARSHSKLEAIVLARQLAAYTIRITKNQNTFPPEYNNGITNKIIDTATSIYMDCWTANNIYVNKDVKLWEERNALQQKAALNCNNLLALIQLSQEVFHLKSRRIKYWSEKVIEVRNKIRGWNESDDKRYGNLT